MSSTHGNDPHGPPKLNLTDEEREAAREVIARMLDEADALGGGVLAGLWRAEAEELRRLCLEPESAEPEPAEPVVIQCASCTDRANEIGEHGHTLSAACAADPDAERQVVAYGHGGIHELRALYTDRGWGPAPSGEWWALFWKAPTVEAVEQLAREGELTSIIGIGPKRAAVIEAALHQHREGGRS